MHQLFHARPNSYASFRNHHRIEGTHGMQPLPSPPQPAAVLSFDFDGTLHDPAAVPPVPAGFFTIIRRLRKEQQVVWGINTGRSLAHMLDGFVESCFPFLPDWVITREREIHFPNIHGRWSPHTSWNERCEREINELFHNSRQVLSRIRQEIEHHTGAKWLKMPGEPAGFICRTEQEMAWIIEHISPLVATQPGLSWQRNSIYLRFGHHQFHKGSSLAEITRLYQLGTDHCFAMGDGHNDLEMLNPAYAGMTACPANAVPPIQQLITATGGLITRASHGQAAIEALHHFFMPEA